MRKFFSALSLLQSAVALTLIFGCLYAAQWQFDRGQGQTYTNNIIRENLELDPIEMSDPTNLDAVANQWRLTNIEGSFSMNHQELVRNRYYEGKFGFEVLTLFTAVTGENFWVDRGWVAAGKDASTPPDVPAIDSGINTITARIRSENLSRQLQGSFFVTSAKSAKPESIAKIQGVDAQPYYLDLISSSNEKVTPLTEIQLPELTSGPHYAYALQWLAFAALALIGRILLFREAQGLPLVKLEI